MISRVFCLKMVNRRQFVSYATPQMMGDEDHTQVLLAYQALLDIRGVLLIQCGCSLVQDEEPDFSDQATGSGHQHQCQ